MKKILDIETRPENRNGKSRKIMFLEGDNVIVQRIKVGGKTTYDIEYSKENFSKVFAGMANVQAQVNKEEFDGDEVIDAEELQFSTKQKIDLINQIAGTIDESEVKRLRSEQGGQLVESNELFFDTSNRYKARDDIEKTTEIMLQTIYDEWGEDYFTLSEFEEVYNQKFSTGQADVSLLRLYRKDRLVRTDVEDTDGLHGNTKYKYKLAEQVLRQIREYGSLLGDNPAWQSKKYLLNPEVRKNYT